MSPFLMALTLVLVAYFATNIFLAIYLYYSLFSEDDDAEDRKYNRIALYVCLLLGSIIGAVFVSVYLMVNTAKKHKFN